MAEKPHLLWQTKDLLKKTGEGTYLLDAQGYTCPYPQLLARTAFGLIETGARLDILTDNPSSCENVPTSVRNLEQKVLGVQPVSPGLWKIVAQKVR
ncbi:MAG TPA: sulfurtransferase TusA family protein [Thermoplasmata archaeon]|nr:sulfurtransferase TusA family protein [Thermoplasmata archaeon]